MPNDPASIDPSLPPDSTAATSAEQSKNNQENPSEALANKGQSEAAAQGLGQAQTTAKLPKNQEKPPELTTLQRIDKRRTAVSQALADKELHVLSTIFQKVPEPFYNRWKSEANENFSLLVMLKHRRRKMLSRAS